MSLKRCLVGSRCIKGFGLLLAMATSAVAVAQNAPSTNIPVKPEFKAPVFRGEQPNPLITPKVLPDLKNTQSGKLLSDSPSMFVKQIKLTGSTVFSTSELNKIFAQYQNREITLAELQALRHELSLHYFKLGFVNSGVVIPEQSIKDGVIELRAIEGALSSIRLSGNENLRDRYIKRRLKVKGDGPLNVNALQQTLRTLQENRLISKVNAQLKSGSRLGQAELDLVIEETPSRELYIGANNHRTPSIGAEQLTLGFTDFNLTGNGDTLNLSVSGSEGLTQGAFSYSLPITASDALFSIFYEQSDTEVVEEPFEQLDIESESSSYGFSFSVPVSKRNGQATTLSLGVTHKESEAFLLGEPFSFSVGAIEGETKSTSVDLGIDYYRRSAKRVFAILLSARQGIDSLGSNVNENDDVADSEFTAFVGQLQYAQQLPILNSGQVIVRAATQISLDPLLSIEKLSVGGYATVRGYRENQLVRDNGITASLEFRLPVWNNKNSSTSGLQGVVFGDWGQAWDKDAVGQSDEKINIYSAGVGLLWEPVKYLNLEVVWGKALEDELTDNQSGDLQDDGLHLSVGYGYRF